MEDLVYIDDLEVIIYTTISPKTSTIFVTHTKKQQATQGPKVEIVTLQNIGKKKEEIEDKEPEELL